MPSPDFATEIAALETALASGELTIEQDGERVTYKSTKDMVTALTYFRQRAATLGSAAGRPAAATTVAAFEQD